MKRCQLLLVPILLLATGRVAAQTPTPHEELLRLVPPQFGLVLTVQDLRGHAEKWEASSWLKNWRDSALGQALRQAPELQELFKFQTDLQKHLGIDWPTLRDDILGDAVVFAYQAGADGKPNDERGLFLVQARRPDKLAALIGKINLLQKANGELKALEPLTHQGVIYQRRVEAKSAHYYLLQGGLLVYSAEEPLIHWVIDKQREVPKSPGHILKHLRRAGAERAFASLWVDPRAFDAELLQKAQQAAGPEAGFLKPFLAHWQALDALVFSCTFDERLEARLAVLARDKDLPAALRKLYTEPAQASDLWNRFPQNAVFSVAGRIDVLEIADAMADMVPAEARRSIQSMLDPVAALLGIDLRNDLLRHIGPDWGLAVYPATSDTEFPHVVAALAVQPGNKKVRADQTIYRGAQFFAGMAVMDYNSKNAEPIRLKTVQQGAVEVKYFSNPKVFPEGLEPALALKDGYLLLASAPKAIERFTLATSKPAVSKDVPVVRFSATEMAKLLRGRKQQVIAHIAAKNNVSEAEASRHFEGLLSVLGLFDRAEVTHESGGGRLAWTVRLYPAP
ncbi:MAG: hypothetical protein L0Y72_23470 [Gemmataceae bacterium]|nr:hypothetical protein [Gemmataceae bacterium]